MALFITIDGGDGCGKTTQALMLVESLKSMGIQAVYEKEPTKGPIGTFLMDLIRSGRCLSEECFALLFAADRQWHNENTIRHLLRSKDVDVVVCDRYWMSTFAYQGKGNARRMTWITHLHSDVAKPDLAIMIYVPAEESVRRLKVRGITDSFEREELVFKMEKYLNEAYNWVEQCGISTAKIDGEGTEEQVQERILEVMKEFGVRAGSGVRHAVL